MTSTTSTELTAGADASARLRSSVNGKNSTLTYDALLEAIALLEGRETSPAPIVRLHGHGTPLHRMYMNALGRMIEEWSS
jgi:hypothetical protein